jgi:hypothetical protein
LDAPFVLLALLIEACFYGATFVLCPPRWRLCLWSFLIVTSFPFLRGLRATIHHFHEKGKLSQDALGVFRMFSAIHRISGKWGGAQQEIAHRQLAGEASITNILDALQPAWPEIARKAQVQMIVPELTFAHKTIETVDVTGIILDWLKADAATRKVILEMQRRRGRYTFTKRAIATDWYAANRLPDVPSKGRRSCSGRC